MTHKFRIHMERDGRGRVWVDDHEIDSVKAVKFEAGVDCPTRVFLELEAVEVSAEGPAEIVKG